MHKVKNDDSRFIWGMLSPTIIVFIAGIFFPLVYGLWLSLFYTDNNRKISYFAGIGNYTNLLIGGLSRQFYHVYYNTIFFTVFTVFFELILGLLIALLINKSFKGRGILRAAVLVPWAIPTIVNAQLWEYMFNGDQYGLVNNILSFFGYIDLNKNPNSGLTFTTNGDFILINLIFLISLILFIGALIILIYSFLKSIYNSELNEFLSSRFLLYLLVTLVVSSLFALFLPLLFGVDPIYGGSNAILGGNLFSIAGFSFGFTTKLPTPLLVILLIDIWKTTPFMALLILASLQVIPQDLYKAASVDGASSFQQFRQITLPLIIPGIGTALIFRCIDAFRVYDIIAVFGLIPNIYSISFFAYQQQSTGFTGTASAVAVLTFIKNLAFSIAFFNLTRRRNDV